MPSKEHRSRAATVELWIGAVIGLALIALVLFGDLGWESYPLHASFTVLYALLAAMFCTMNYFLYPRFGYSCAATAGFWIGTITGLFLAVFFGAVLGGLGGESRLLNALLTVLYIPMAAVFYVTHYFAESIFDYPSGGLPQWLDQTKWLLGRVALVLCYAFLGRAVGGWWGRRRNAPRTKD